MNSLIDLLRQAARLSGQRLERSRLPAVRDAIERSERTDPLSRFMAVWRAGGLRGLPVRIRTPEPTDLPVLAWTEATGYVLLDGVGADGALAGRDAKGAPATLMPERDMSFLRLATREDVELVPRALPLIRQAVWKHKAAVFESVVATFVVSLLALGTSLYSMQIYDRVIPNQGYQTLWVLTAGALGAILLEWVLKQVRTHIMDRAGLEIDKDLSQWFFERLQGARMDARPATVGTLAAQVKGFETVRAMLTSTSLYILADIPFAIFFVLVIASLGGVLVVVPVIALPLALAAGLGFQRAIWNQARKMTASSYRKNGLLVEAVEAAESVKANRGEWQLARRWHDLVVAVSEADERIRVYSAWSQNITALLQQGGYIALVAAGAWMVTNNHLTMGALLAITIISNRAMTPILQLPGVLVQWAHARSALEGLDQIIALPNEQDGIGERLLPETLAASVRFERVRFSYGMQRTALEIEALRIAPGERVGLIGSVGSGKSTLLKLASGLYRPQEGRVFLGDLDASVLHPAVMRENIAYLPQDHHLVSGTLRQNLLLGLSDPGDEQILEAAQRTGLHALISAAPEGLALPLTEGGRGVSGGQRQLIALTRLVLASPRLWLLDEPTASMDNESEARVIQLLHQLVGPEHTLLVTTHKTAFLPMLTRLVVVRDGRILMDGPRDEIMAVLQGRTVPAAGAKA